MDIGKILRDRGCLYPHDEAAGNHHFIGASGKHLAGYFTVDPILPDQALLWRLAGMLAGAFGDAGPSSVRPQVVVSPGPNAITLGSLTAIQLIHDLPGIADVSAVWGTKVLGSDGMPVAFRLERGFQRLVAGMRVLLVDDIVNQAFTLSLLGAAVAVAGGEVVGVGAVVHNDVTSAMFGGVPFVGLLKFDYPVWTENECLDHGPCANYVPIVTDAILGKGQRYRERHPELPDERFVRLLAA